MKKSSLAKATLWANRGVMVLVAALILPLPSLTLWYCGLLGFEPPMVDFVVLMVCFYACVGVIFTALWNMEKLMGNILKQEVFTGENVRRIRNVQWCCGIVAAITFVAAVFAWLMVVIVAIMGFLCLVVGVVASVMDAAVALREENDLTI